MDAEKLAMQRRIDTLDQYATRLHAALTEAERENARLKAELEAVKRERGALKRDLYMRVNGEVILLDGKHLDLVKDLEDFQSNNPAIMPETSAEFFVLFDEYMMNKNSMGTRKPSAVKTGAKKAYVRDEPKLWNKLGIIKMQGVSRYFIPFEGIEFNWERINEILLSNVYGGLDE